jgi:GntR family transcriptional regulator
LKLDKNSVQPLYVQLEAILRQQIENGVLNPGDRLPPENTLAAEYGISRMTARRATEALVTDGILVRHPGKGTFVADDKVPFMASTLSSFSSTMRGLGLAVTSRIIELDLVTPSPKVVRDLRLQPGEQAVFLRRVRYINGEAIAVMSSYMPGAYLLALQEADLSHQPITQVMEAASGLRIVKADDYLEASLARPEEAELLGIRIGAPVFLGRGILYESQGTPVRSSKVVYRGDRFRISFSASSAAGTEIRLPQQGQPADQSEKQWLALAFDLAE